MGVSGGGIAQRGVEELGDEVAADEAALLGGGEAECVCGEAVEVAHGAEGGFMQKGQGAVLNSPPPAPDSHFAGCFALRFARRTQLRTPH